MSNKFEDILEELDRRYENGEVSEEKYRELRERIERVKREANSLTNPNGRKN